MRESFRRTGCRRRRGSDRGRRSPSRPRRAATDRGSRIPRPPETRPATGQAGPASCRRDGCSVHRAAPRRPGQRERSRAAGGSAARPRGRRASVGGRKLRVEGLERQLESPLGIPRRQPLGAGERGCVLLGRAVCARGEAIRGVVECGQRVARRAQSLRAHQSDGRPLWATISCSIRERLSVVHRTSPASGTSLPASNRSRVLLPAPLSPITARRSPAVTVSETLSITGPSPNPLRRSRARRCGPERESDGARAPTISERMTFLPAVVTSRRRPRRADLHREVRRYRKLCGVHVMHDGNYHASSVVANGEPAPGACDSMTRVSTRS